MIFEEGLVTQGRYPEQPIQIQDMDKAPFKVGDAVINKISGGSVFLISDAPYKFVYARRAPPEPYYIDWFVKLDNGAEVSTSILRLATRTEVSEAISETKRSAELAEVRIQNLEKYNERTLN